MKLNELTIKEAREGLIKRDFSSRELVEACLSRIKELEPKINAFITVCEKEAVARAGEKDREIGAIGETREIFQKYPLLGIPIAVKDLFCTKGIKTTAGSKVLENYVSQYDATTVVRLKNAGAIILGKNNCDAWGHGASGEHSDYGVTRNPWDLSQTPGGSSSGGGVSVSADECLAVMCTDTGGSIRYPATFCGLVGLKPSYGRVSRYGIIAMASSLDSIGHITKSVEDSGLLLSLTAGKDQYDATTSSQPVFNYTKNINGGVKGIQIGIPKEYFIKGMDERIEKKIKEAIQKLRSLGAKVEEISLPHTKYAVPTYYIIQPAEVSSNLARYDGIRFGNTRETFGDEAKRRIMLGTYTLSAGYYDAYYLKAMKVRTLIRKDFEDAFRKVDVLITPVSPHLPFKLGEKTENPLELYLEDIFTATVNLAGIPALAIPCGFVDNLPIGMQIIGPQFSEELLFRVGYAYELETQWRKIRPEI